MRFDDRLLTVLNQPAGDSRDAAVRWRQLVDLVARSGQSNGSSVVAAALDAIRTEAPQVDVRLRAATARAVAALPLPLELLEYFAGDELSVAAPVFAAATLDDGQWRALRALANDETRQFITTLHPELEVESRRAASGLTEDDRPVAEAKSAAATPDADYMPPSLREVVERIERRRRVRTEQPSGPSHAVAAKTEKPARFRWECGPGGDIVWVEGAPRGALIGRSLAKPQNSDPDVVRAFAMRAPFRDAVLTVGGGGPVTGDWKISGVPAFEPSEGRFAGYRGVALREAPTPTAPASASDVIPEVLADPDSLRELIHEIKTPLNAILGFAEIIEGQYLGPADRGYRERASEIIRQARKLLTAIDDLDFAAKIHSAAGAARERVDLSMLVERGANELRAMADRFQLEVDLVRPRSEVAAATQPELADRLLVCLFAAVADRAEPGERLQLVVDASNGNARISISKPLLMRKMDERELFGATRDAEAALAGFSLKLVRGLARIAGGDLVSNRETLSLVFPRA